MSRGFAKITAVGNITRDPEYKLLPSGSGMLKFSIACNDSRGDKEYVEFLDCVIWDKFADAMKDILSKGRQVFIHGRPRTRSWEDDQKVKHYRMEIHVDDLVLCADGGGAQRRDREPQQDDGGAYDFPSGGGGGRQGQAQRTGRFG